MCVSKGMSFANSFAIALQLGLCLPILETITFQKNVTNQSNRGNTEDIVLTTRGTEWSMKLFPRLSKDVQVLIQLKARPKLISECITTTTGGEKGDYARSIHISLMPKSTNEALASGSFFALKVLLTSHSTYLY